MWETTDYPYIHVGIVISKIYNLINWPRTSGSGQKDSDCLITNNLSNFLCRTLNIVLNGNLWSSTISQLCIYSFGISDKSIVIIVHCIKYYKTESMYLIQNLVQPRSPQRKQFSTVSLRKENHEPVWKCHQNTVYY